MSLDAPSHLSTTFRIASSARTRTAARFALEPNTAFATARATATESRAATAAEAAFATRLDSAFATASAIRTAAAPSLALVTSTAPGIRGDLGSHSPCPNPGAADCAFHYHTPLLTLHGLSSWAGTGLTDHAPSLGRRSLSCLCSGRGMSNDELPVPGWARSAAGVSAPGSCPGSEGR